MNKIQKRRKKVVDKTARDILGRMMVLEPEERYVLLEEYGEIIYYPYSELEIDWIKKSSFRRNLLT